MIRDIRRLKLPDVVRIVVELDREVPFHDERIENPSRVFLDLPSTEAASKLRDQTIRFDGDSDLIRQVRLGRHPNSTTRVVLDAADVTSYSVYPLYNPFRLVIDCLRPTPSEAAAPPPLPPPAVASSRLPSPEVRPPARSAGLVLSIRRIEPWARMLPFGTPGAADAIREALFVPPLPVEPTPLPATPAVFARLPSTPAPPAPAPQPVIPPAVVAPSTNLNGGFSLARQLGMGVSRIVIDPGHGGHDPGARSGGTSEAELVLDIARRLETLLLANPGMEVVLTRRDDEFIPLQERTAIANRESADLFLSIHANASAATAARGVETYFLNFATTLSAAAVAARENAASGHSMGELPDVVRTIALNNKIDESKDFATHVQRELVAKLRGSNKALKDLGVKQAPFQVLIGAAMPSVLAEVSFITNTQEARLLKQGSYRQRIAEGLHTAIRKYQGSLTKVSTIAQQP
jgi:N-acetylmuramoyl-L-alanine amidase